MRIGIAVDYGKYANASSLNLIARKIFLELGKIMNEKKTFTISAIKYDDIGIGDVNLHYDCVSVPNMGGYKFPHLRTLSSNNLIIGLSGIDEVVLGEQVYKSKKEWLRNKLIIEKEVPKWEKYSDKIRLVHVPTNADKEQMVKYLKIPSEKIHVISHGVDHEIFKPALDKEKSRKKILGAFYMKNHPYFIHVSESNWARKNVFRMLEAFKKAREAGIRHNLIIVGRMDSIVYQEARSISGVTTLGFVSTEHLSKLIQCADALIFPSLHEGFGLPLAEAMSCGVPVITSNVFSPPEVVGNAGLFVDPYDVSDITNKIIEMSNNESLRIALSQTALERSRKFVWEDVAKALFKLIQQTTSNSNHFDFKYNLDLAAYRTLTTVCEITPGLKEITQQDLLAFDYSKIISWAIESGLENPDVGDFLIPFKEWLIAHES